MSTKLLHYVTTQQVIVYLLFNHPTFAKATAGKQPFTVYLLFAIQPLPPFSHFHHSTDSGHLNPLIVEPEPVCYFA